MNFLREIEYLIQISLIPESELQISRINDYCFEGWYQDNEPAVYYTMDFIELGELYSFLEGEPFTEKISRNILSQVLASLSILHKYENFHFDLKPENILVDIKGNLFIGDFGNSICLKKS